jgi:SAM-dependent methyltransferase
MVWRENGWRELTCPACHDTHLMPKRLDANPPYKPRERFALFQCEACGTLHYPDAKVFEYESRKDADLARKFYLEVGAGLDAMLAPLAWTDASNVERFLEVGGGYGFSVDFASRELGWTAANIDPSFLARTGAADLGHDHIAAYLAADHPLADQSFDRVLSSEVIEHVKDPDPFLDALGAALSPDGILLLTTPNAAVVTASAGLDRLLPVITAGHHLVIFSPAGLEATLRRAGYEHVVIEENDLTLLAAASHRPFEIDLEARPDRSRLQAYFADRLDALGGDPALFSGFAVRLLKEYVHTAQWEAAEAVRQRIRRRWMRDYGLDIDSPAGINPRFVRTERGGRRRLRKFAAYHPFSLAIALYYSACIHREAGRTEAALSAFVATTRLAATLQTVFSAMYAACRETEDLGIRSQLAAADLGADKDPAAAAQRLGTAFGQIGAGMEAEWYRIACRVYAAGALTGRCDAVASIEPSVRGHLEAQIESGTAPTPAQGYAAAGLAGRLAESGRIEAARQWLGFAAEAMTDPQEKDVFDRRRAELDTRREDNGQALINAVNQQDNRAAAPLAQQLVSENAPDAISQPVAFALGLYHLNMAANPEQALAWFRTATEKASGPDRSQSLLHQALATERLSPADRQEILPNLLTQLEKEPGLDPHLESQIRELAARYNPQSGEREAAS